MAESPAQLARHVAGAVSERRVMEETYRFISVPSPTGAEAEFADLYAGALADLGLQVSLDKEFPSSPSVVARLKGSGGGPTLQLDGHTDTVPVSHDESSIDLAGGVVRGRGAADMKGGLAAICEAVRALQQVGVRPAGDVLVTAHGLHEAPLGDQRTIRSLLRRGIAGDAAIIAELGHDHLATASRGMSIFRIGVHRQGAPMHEVELRERSSNPIAAVRLLLDRLDERAGELAAQPDDFAGPETLFLGEVHSGDFYNRVPVEATIVGTRRYRPPATTGEVRAELEALCREVAAETGLDLDVSLQEVGPAYALDHDEPVVTALRNGYEAVVGSELPLAAAQAVGNATDFVSFGVPAVYHGVNQQTAHSDDEHVSGSDLARAARVLAASVIHFCGVEEKETTR